MLEIANSKIVGKEWHSCWAAWEFEIVISGVRISDDGGAIKYNSGRIRYPALSRKELCRCISKVKERKSHLCAVGFGRNVLFFMS
jgi:hypothetical protein